MLDRIVIPAGLLIVAAVAFSSFTPAAQMGTFGNVEQQSVEPEPEATPTRRPPPPPTTVWGNEGGGHTLSRQFDGHFYASARVEGTGVRMMVDTGASVIALTGQDASAIGLHWNDTDVQPVARGANGTVYGVRAQLREVEIGGMVRRNVSAVIIPQGLDVSLLGQSYLSQIGSVEISGNEMVFKDR